MFKKDDRVIVVRDNHDKGAYLLQWGKVRWTTDTEEYDVYVRLDEGGSFNFDSSELELEETYDALSASLTHEGNSCCPQVDMRYTGDEGEKSPGEADMVAHPSHYTSHPSGVECIEITKHYNFPIGSAMKYLWRAGLKDEDTKVQDLQKAIKFIEFEIERLGGTV